MSAFAQNHSRSPVARCDILNRTEPYVPSCGGLDAQCNFYIIHVSRTVLDTV